MYELAALGFVLVYYITVIILLKKRMRFAAIIVVGSESAAAMTAYLSEITNPEYEYALQILMFPTYAMVIYFCARYANEIPEDPEERRTWFQNNMQQYLQQAEKVVGFRSKVEGQCLRDFLLERFCDGQIDCIEDGKSPVGQEYAIVVEKALVGFNVRLIVSLPRRFFRPFTHAAEYRCVRARTIKAKEDAITRLQAEMAKSKQVLFPRFAGLRTQVIPIPNGWTNENIGYILQKGDCIARLLNGMGELGVLHEGVYLGQRQVQEIMNGEAKVMSKHFVAHFTHSHDSEMSEQNVELASLMTSASNDSLISSDPAMRNQTTMVDKLAGRLVSCFRSLTKKGMKVYETELTPGTTGFCEEGDDLYIIEFYEPHNPPDEVVEEARKLVAMRHGRYCLCTNNCQGVASICKTGKNASHQIHAIKCGGLIPSHWLLFFCGGFVTGVLLMNIMKICKDCLSLPIQPFSRGQLKDKETFAYVYIALIFVLVGFAVYSCIRTWTQLRMQNYSHAYCICVVFANLFIVLIVTGFAFVMGLVFAGINSL